MANTLDTLVFSTLTNPSTTTNFSFATLGYNIVFITIINNNTDTALTIFNSQNSFATSISLAIGQGITFTAANNMVLPDIRVVSSTGTISISIVHN
jgi:hypothetical protein